MAFYEAGVALRVKKTVFPTEAEREVAFQARRKEFDGYVSSLKHKGLHALSGEIDRCLKKVSEGVETFEDIWQKVHNATNTNQKEKYETDLKKEIKKLQRLRDQIKSWIASGEIKDKSTLVDTRKLIETQMERFKVVERETKTKAYSKEGLGAAQKLDPMTRERDDLNNWLVGSIDQLQVQMDQFESEIELMMAGKKKRLDKDKQDRLDELKSTMEKHKFHMSKLETLMRMLDNLAADPNALRNFLNQVKKIKDDIEYYLESHQEPEYEENEFMYDDIDGLEEQQALGNSVGAGEDGPEGSPTSTTSGNTSPVSPIHSSDSSSDPEKRRKSSDDSSKVVRPVAMKPNHTSSPSPAGGKAGSGGVTADTPPINPGTPNNSSPSSGLMSNHVSSFSSLSSSPTQTQIYHNALNNAKSLPQLDGVEHNNTESSNATISESTNNILLSSSSANGDLSHSLGLQNSSETFDPSSTLGSLSCNSPPTSTSTSSSVPIPLLPTTTSSSSVSSSATTTATSNGLTNSFPPPDHYGHPAEELPPSPPPPPTIHDPKAHLYHHLGLRSNSEEGLGLENGTGENHVGSESGDGPPPPRNHPLSSLAAMSMTALVNHSNVNNVNHLNLSHLTNNASSGGGGSGVVVHSSASSNGSISIGSTGAPQQSISATSLISTNSTFSSQQQQQTQQPQSQSKGQPGSSREVTSPSSSGMDYMRIAPEQMLLDRYLNSGDSDTIDRDAMATLKSMAQEAMDRAGIHDPSSLQRTTTEAHIPPLLGVAPLGPVPLGRDHQTQFQMLEAGHYHMPVPADSERMRQFLPRNPIPTPSYYPQAPLVNSDSLDFFGRLSIETLFFIFYYLEGTKAQYLAAKVLKKQSWRFHTKYMMWFQRHEEPKVINEEYEQGTYIYFDIEKWGQRKKDGFVFEYRYLEDRDLS